MKKWLLGSDTLARRLVLAFGGSFFVLSLISGFALYGLVHHQLSLARKGVLQDRMDAISEMILAGARGRSEMIHRVTHQWPNRSGERVIVQITDHDSVDGLVSPGAPESLLSQMAVLEAPIRDEPAKLTATEDGRTSVSHFDVIAKRLDPMGATIRVAIGDEQSREYLAQLQQRLVAVLAFQILVSLVAGSWVVRRETQSLRKMAATMAEVDARNLNVRLPERRLPLDLATLARAFNRMMDDLELSIQRISQFSSDLAHELRTPISNIMGSIEVTLSKPRSENEYREVLGSCLEECARIHRISDSLLFLARTENDTTGLRFRAVDLEREMQSLVDFYQPLAEQASVRLKWSSVATPPIWAEPTLFQRALGNLIENALRHVQPGGTVEVGGRLEKGHVIIAVKDDGFGIDPHDLPRIFERFYRANAGRVKASGGAGLGLAIVKSIMEVHEGSVSVETELGRGTVFHTLWPASNSDQSEKV